MNVIGLDIGHSAVKVAATLPSGKAVRVMFPSVICREFKISDDTERARAAAETVHVGNRAFFFGETARTQGGTSITTGLSEDWIDTPEHAALLLGAWRKIVEAGVATDDVMLVLGLPTHLFGRQRDCLRENVGTHLQVKDIKVMPQAMGPYQATMLLQNGTPNPGRQFTGESWGVVEVGHFTTDFMLVQRGRWVEKASGVCSGARVAAEHLTRLLGQRKITVDILESEEAIQTGHVRDFGRRLDVTPERTQAISLLVDEVVDTATRLMEPYARKLDGVIVAGGGANLVFERLRERWPHAIKAEDPRFSVAEGMRRFGSALSLARAMLATPA